MTGSAEVDALTQQQFRANLEDWCCGGPKPGGYTRLGASCQVPDLILSGQRLAKLPTQQLAAKNAREFERWHLSLLRSYLRGADCTATAYWNEYLLARLAPDQARARLTKFIELFESIRSSGIASPAKVVDVRGVLPMKYFRFDGAHRTACAEVLGIRRVPTVIFSTNARQSSGSRWAFWRRG